MRRLLLLALAALWATGGAAAERSVSLPRPFGTLSGTLSEPEGGSGTVALIIAGSGPTDRNGNSPAGIGADTYLLMARALDEAGIASLRYDKRGVGLSRYDHPERMADVVFGDFVDDAVAWAEYLRAEGYRRVVLVGHSEGATIALCAAQQAPWVAAVVSAAGPAYPMDEILRIQLAAQLMPANMTLMLEAERIIARLKAGERMAPEGCDPVFRQLFPPAVQPFLISAFAIDPREVIRRVEAPVLVIGGDNDLQITADNAEALARAQPEARRVVVAGMTHMLKHDDGHTLGEQTDVYTNPSLPLDPAFAAALTAFILEP